MADNPFHTGEILKQMERVKHELPILLANQAQRHFTESFSQGGYEGKPWKEVQRRIQGTSEYKYPMNKGLSRRTSPILVRTGKLRRMVSNSIRTKTFELIRLVAALPYASYQNEGTDDIEARPYMRDSPGLRKIQNELITKTFGKVFPNGGH